MKFWRGFGRMPIRQKLLALVLMPLLGVLPLLGLVLLIWGNNALDQLLVTKVRSDLAVAQGYFERVLGEVGASTAAVADSHALSLVMGHTPGETKTAAMTALLQRAKARERLDFINLRSADGRLLFSDTGPVADARALTPNEQTDSTSVEVLSADQLALLAPTLREHIVVPLVPTRNAAPTERQREDRAMVLLATRLVRDTDGRVLGQVQGGLLLNRNLPFIDHINGIVYPEGSLPYGSQGTATLFLDDVRISTNVRLFGGERDDRAIGTRVSMAVREAVLVAGRTWLDRAFVVNDWYVSGYLPISNRAAQRIGMLYVGFSEAPFRWVKYGVLLGIGALFFGVMVLAALVCLRWARSIFAPLERMARTMQSVGAGEMTARVGPLASNGATDNATDNATDDEISQLAGHLDHLLDTVQGHTQALDAKVAERTAELQTAQSQLVRAEKLAAVGQLTASIAHEVNNPIAVIQGNLDVLRETLGAQAQPVQAELALIDAQVERMRLIVTQLLQFARPTEFAGYVAAVDVNRLLEDSLLLVAHLLNKSNIQVKRDWQALQPPAINRNELQQVLVNLLVNAIHAMPTGGTLALRSCDHGAGVQITVTDTGNGLGPELIAELFKPFVTRKKDGTGLGLWISRTIVERYGGELLAADRSDGVRGAVFTVLLKL
jgi:two-component system, NtrC family, sensor kinase